MKSFKDYLTESKKVYEFKVKIAGDCPKDCAGQIKKSLAQYQVEKCSAGKSTPIQETQEEFPGLNNVGLTIYDITTSYPVNSLQVRNAIAEGTGIALNNVIVRTTAEQAEYNINHANDAKSGATLGTDYEKSNNQDKVGAKHMMSFLKELDKTKHAGEAYTGTNDQLLAKKAPSEKQSEQSDDVGTVSAIGSKKTKLPDPLTGK